METSPGALRNVGCAANRVQLGVTAHSEREPKRRRRLVLSAALSAIVGLAGCSAEMGGNATPGTGGNAGPGSGGNGTGNSGVSTGTGGGGVSTGTGGRGVSTGTGGGGVSTGTGGGGVSTGTGGAVSACTSTPAPGRAPIRRLTHYEYNNTVKDLLADTTSPGSALPAETLSNTHAIFGNNADFQSVSSLLAEKYGTVAEDVAARATATTAALGKLHTCGSSITATTVTATEDTCARNIATSLAARAYRRPATTAELDELVALYKTVRTGRTFASGVAGMIEALLQSPDFLYRVEFGVADATKPSLKRPTGYEMATRLSYLFWGTMPDPALTTIAANGTLTTTAGVLNQAKAMLDDSAKRSHTITAYFFDSLLPINALPQLERNDDYKKVFTPAIATLMHQETQRFLEYEIFEGPGTLTNIFTAPYTFVNDALAAYYGMPAVTGSALQKVPTDTKKRIGVLTQGGFMAGSTVSNVTNPVLRGSFVVQKLMCRVIPLPTGDILAMVKPPDPYSAATGRERYALHRTMDVCNTCHQYMDPVGLTFENFDPIGQWRDTEGGETIDASGSLPGTTGTVSGPVELMQKLASADVTQTCFADHWMEYAYGRPLETADACTQQTVENTFRSSGSNVKQLLLALTQTDAFLYLSPSQ